MTLFLIIVHVIVCLTLILVILLQAGRGQGLAGPAFGGGNVQSLFGTRAGDFLSKATTVAAICFLLTSIGLDYLETLKSKSLLELKRPGPALDMDAIKKALEKVKTEQAEETRLPAEVNPAGSTEPAAVSDDLKQVAADQQPVVPAEAADVPQPAT